ncbi:unnamed protein product [Lampetra planeri]
MEQQLLLLVLCALGSVLAPCPCRECWRDYIKCADEGLEEVPLLDPSLLENDRPIKKLFLGGNRLRVLRAGSLARLPSLERLSIRASRVAQLEAGVFQGLLRLQVLELQDNELEEVPADLMTDLPALRTLDMSDNRVRVLPAEGLSRLSRLRDVYLHGNALRELPRRAFAGCVHLRRLYLHGNALTSLRADGQYFAGARSLQVLDLHGNQLLVLDVALLLELPGLQLLDLSNNRLRSPPALNLPPRDPLPPLGPLPNPRPRDPLTSTTVAPSPSTSPEPAPGPALGPLQLRWLVLHGNPWACEDVDAVCALRQRLLDARVRVYYGLTCASPSWVAGRNVLTSRCPHDLTTTTTTTRTTTTRRTTTTTRTGRPGMPGDAMQRTTQTTNPARTKLRGTKPQKPVAGRPADLSGQSGGSGGPTPFASDLLPHGVWLPGPDGSLLEGKQPASSRLPPTSPGAVLGTLLLLTALGCVCGFLSRRARARGVLWGQQRQGEQGHQAVLGPAGRDARARGD